MRIEGSRFLVTGGGGGIARAFAAELLAHGGSVLLADRDAAALAAARDAFATQAGHVGTIVVDLASAADRERLVGHACAWQGGIDALVNNAGVNHFRLFEDTTSEQVDLALAVNVQAPLHLCRALLPHLRRRPAAHVVNVGSVFGSIGHPAYSVYCATKFAIRGFTEALRRELADTTVRVHYFAPRATRTGINGAAVEAMNAELGVAMDAPARVAAELRAMLQADAPERIVGWPEKLYARLNGVLPGLVDGALARQLPVIRRYARPGTAVRDLAAAPAVGSPRP